MSDGDRLAIDGGEPAGLQFRGPTFPGGDLVGAEEEEAVVRVVRSGRLYRHVARQFPPPPGENNHLEQELAARFGVTSALTVSSGTASLQCAIAALGLAPGDEVLVPAFTFIATAAAVVLAGAIPVVVDVDETLGMDPADVEHRITDRTRAIIVVHMRGGACDMRALLAVAERRGLPIIEDVAQAAGSSYGGRPLGSLGSLGCFSFQFNKIITAGEGGAVVAGDPALFRRAFIFSDTVSWLRHDSNVTDDEIMFGMNARLPEISAAILRVQLRRLDTIIANGRRRHAQFKAAFVEATGDPAAVRGAHDPEGDNGTAFIFFAPTPAAAEFIAKALHGERVFCGRLLAPDHPDPRQDSHVYCGWRPMVERRSWSRAGVPWSQGRRDIDYSPAAHPRSIERLARAVQIDIHSSPGDDFFAGIAHAIRKVLHDPRAGFR